MSNWPAGLAEFVSRLHHAVQSLTGARPLRDWVTALGDGVSSIARVADADAWQLSQLQREFNDILQHAAAQADTELRLPDIHAMLHGHLAGRPTRANFRTGTLTVCTMVPDALGAASGGVSGRSRRHCLPAARHARRR